MGSGRVTDIVGSLLVVALTVETGAGSAVRAVVSCDVVAAGVAGLSPMKRLAVTSSMATTPAAIRLFFKPLLFTGTGSLVGFSPGGVVLLSGISKFSG